MTISNLPLQKEEKLITGFIDLLGFTDALSNDENFERLFVLLEQIKNCSGNFCEQVIGTTEEGTKQYHIYPSITAFSDSVFISYEIGGILPVQAILSEITRHIAGIALLALKNGFLIRGAITQGKARHRDGIVLGCPFIEAGKLEKTDAKMPRVLIQPSCFPEPDLDNLWVEPAVHHAVTQKSTKVPDCMFLLKETENIYSLNYVRDMLTIGLTHGDLFYKEMDLRIHEIRNTIANNKNRINIEQSKHSSAKLEKWEWFEKCFEIEVVRWEAVKKNQ